MTEVDREVAERILSNGGRGWNTYAQLEELQMQITTALAAARKAGRADGLEEAASFTETRLQAERGMRDIWRRGSDPSMADAHGDRANALAEAVTAIRNMMKPDYNEGHIVPNATAIRQEEKPHCPSCNSPNTEQVVLNQWRCKACNQHFPWLGKPIKP